MSPLDGAIPEDAIKHRKAFREFAMNQAEPWHREHLGRLYKRWEEWNRLYFKGKMVEPHTETLT